MRLLRLVFILSLAPAISFAQRGGGGGHGGGGGGGFHGGGGGGGFSSGARSMGSVGVSRGFSGGVSGFRAGTAVGGVSRGYAGVSRGYVGGYHGGYGYGYGRYGYGYGYGYRGYYGVGYGWPWWGWGWGYPYWGWGWGWPGYGYGGYDCSYYDCGGYYDTSYGYPYDSGYSGYNGGNYISQAAPPVVVNQNYASPSGTADSYYRQPDYYLVAFTDHTIQAVVNYRVEGDQFVFTTRDRIEKRVPLLTVDRQFSAQINRDRHIDFRLPQ